MKNDIRVDRNSALHRAGISADRGDRYLALAAEQK